MISRAVSIPNRASWPLNCSISAGVSRVIAPYSPSYPARRSTCPSRSRRTPSATHGPAVRAISASGAVLRMVNSSPSSRSRRSYSSSVFFPAAGLPVDAAMTSGSGARLSKGLACAGRTPAGRSASASTRCSTPMVSFFPHTGQRRPAAPSRQASGRRRRRGARRGDISPPPERTRWYRPRPRRCEGRSKGRDR